LAESRRSSCFRCDLGETIPPADPYATITPNSVEATQSLTEIEGLITQADGVPNAWVQLVMHHVCTPGPTCDPVYSISPTTLSGLLTWLQGRVTAGQDVAQTVHQVVASPASPPPDTTSPNAVAISTTNLAGGTGGLLESGDAMTFAYSEAMKPSSIEAGWAGAATPVEVFVNTNPGDDLIVWDPTGATKLALANPVTLGGPTSTTRSASRRRW
jgi:hypothetical protein